MVGKNLDCFVWRMQRRPEGAVATGWEGCSKAGTASRGGRGGSHFVAPLRVFPQVGLSMSRNTNFPLINDSKDPKFFFPTFRMAGYRISFSVMRRDLMLNTTLTPKTIRFG